MLCFAYLSVYISDPFAMLSRCYITTPISYFKFILYVCGSAIPMRLRSGGEDMVRPLSSGKQKYETDESTWPVGQPMTKIGADLQV